MPVSPYRGGKKKRHFTLSDQAYDHLTAIAGDARLSRSEALERLIRSTPMWEGSASLSNGAWPLCIDHSSDSTSDSASDSALFINSALNENTFTTN